ncbi:hypothetical protein, partial [Acetobacter orientalis]|uniref:hypothetical protein n=1 Tax=Acetobacter orientalis TaxID=146474 RepID=UPI0039EC592B
MVLRVNAGFHDGSFFSNKAVPIPTGLCVRVPIPMCGLFINNSYAEILPHACFVRVCGYLMG